MRDPLRDIVEAILEIYSEKLLYVSILNATRQPSLMNDVELLIVVESYNSNDILNEQSAIRKKVLEKTGICIEPYLYSIDDICMIFRSRKLMLAILGGIVPIYQDSRFNMRGVLCECSYSAGESSGYVDVVRNLLCS
ncbi:MAG: hypothetical protein GXO23_07695 [Crenarchaeota archaeon]|nr:hypothetical protein [Thermoproteota archaeon]